MESRLLDDVQTAALLLSREPGRATIAHTENVLPLQKLCFRRAMKAWFAGDAIADAQYMRVADALPTMPTARVSITEKTPDMFRRLLHVLAVHPR